MCAPDYVQKVTFDSYFYKEVQGNSRSEDLKLLFNTVCVQVARSILIAAVTARLLFHSIFPLAVTALR